MTTEEQYRQWCSEPLEDPELVRELREIEGKEEEIADRFYTDLDFGTAGLRGVLGAGTNRMNIYTVRRATQGLANYIKAQGDVYKRQAPHPHHCGGSVYRPGILGRAVRRRQCFSFCPYHRRGLRRHFRAEPAGQAMRR